MDRKKFSSTARTYILILLTLVTAWNYESQGQGSEQLSEICSDNAPDNDGDGIPDDCDCDPSMAAVEQIAVTGPGAVCNNETHTYSVVSSNQLVINEVDFTNSDRIELKNFGSQSVNIAGYFICANSNCTAIGEQATWRPESGDLVVDPGELLVLEGGFFNPNSDIAIFRSQITTPENMVAYVNYGVSPAQMWLNEAMSAGLWHSVDDFVEIEEIEVGETIEYDGIGIKSSDWNISSGSVGAENDFRTQFIWELEGDGQVQEIEHGVASIDFTNAVESSLFVYHREGRGCINSFWEMDFDISLAQTWYHDEDGDGFGDPDMMTISSCENPGSNSEYVTNGDDCDDTDPEVNPNLEWFLDADGDGLGDPTVKLTQCEDPSDGMSYVNNSLDPDDSKLDADGDEISDADEVNVYQSNPASDDSDDDGLKDNDELALGTDIIDEDSDGDGCIDGKEVTNNTDPLDEDSGGATLWYADSDGDGFGDPSNVIFDCIPPEGFVNDNTDCNDLDPLVFPGAPKGSDSNDSNCDGLADRLEQIIIFNEIIGPVVEGTIIQLIAISSSNLTVEFQVVGAASLDNNQLIINGPGMITVTATQAGDENYLASEESQSFCVTPRKPEVSVSGNELTSSSAEGNRWFRNGGVFPASGQTITPLEDGMYSVQVVIDGCSSQKSDEVSFQFVTGLPDQFGDKVRVYPNPVTDAVTFDLPAISANANWTVEIHDVSGHLFKTTVLNSDSNLIDLTDLRSGIYIYRAFSGESFIRGQLIKQ